MIKAFATEAGCRTLDLCLQVFGGMGLTSEMKLLNAWHQVRMVRIADGSGEIMRRTIAQGLLKGDLGFCGEKKSEEVMAERAA
jgi:acyl-CoA dehydrogenase